MEVILGMRSARRRKPDERAQSLPPAAAVSFNYGYVALEEN
jgi:hypothetical protein